MHHYLITLWQSSDSVFLCGGLNNNNNNKNKSQPRALNKLWFKSCMNRSSRATASVQASSSRWGKRTDYYVMHCAAPRPKTSHWLWIMLALSSSKLLAIFNSCRHACIQTQCIRLSKPKFCSVYLNGAALSQEEWKQNTRHWFQNLADDGTACEICNKRSTQKMNR